MHPCFRTLCATAALAAFASAQCFSVTTTTAAGNGQNGTMFNIVNTSATAITIGSFDQCFLGAGTSAQIQIYTKAGTWSGFESNASAWTLVGSTTNFAHGVAPALDPLPIPVNVTIAAGATQGFYITGDTGTTVAYTSGVGQLGAVIGSDVNLQVTAGVGKSFPFGGTFGLPTAGRAVVDAAVPETAASTTARPAAARSWRRTRRSAPAAARATRRSTSTSRRRRRSTCRTRRSR